MTLENAVSPSILDAFWIRLHQVSPPFPHHDSGVILECESMGIGAYVLMVSIGALENGPIAPETNPRNIVCQLGN